MFEYWIYLGNSDYLQKETGLMLQRFFSLFWRTFTYSLVPSTVQKTLLKNNVVFFRSDKARAASPTSG